MKKNNKPSHSLQTAVEEPLPDRTSFNITEDRIMELVKNRYREESSKFHNIYAGKSITVHVPVNVRYFTESVKKKITDLFVSLGWDQESIRIYNPNTGTGMNVTLSLWKNI